MSTKIVTISLPEVMAKSLKRMSLKESLKKDETITVSSLVKAALEEKYNFNKTKHGKKS